MNGARAPKLFVASFTDRIIKAVEGAPEGIPDFSAGHPTFTPDGKSIVYAAWSNQPRRLGIIFCHNRPSALFVAPNPLTAGKAAATSTATAAPAVADGTGSPLATPVAASSAVHLCLTPKDWMSISPKFSPSGDALYYLSSEEEAPHRFALRLQRLPWSGDAAAVAATAPTVVVNKVNTPKLGEFPGLYCDDIPSGAWSPDGRSLVVPTYYGSRLTIVKVPVSGDVSPVTPVDLGAGQCAD